MQVPVVQQQNIIGQIPNVRQQVSANPDAFGANTNPTAGIITQSKEQLVRQDTAAKMMVANADAGGDSMVNQSASQLAGANMNMANAGMKLGELAGNIAVKLQERQNITMTTDRFNEWNKRITDAFSGEKGFLKTKGEDAVNITKRGTDYIDSVTKEMVDSLGSPATKLAFTQMIDATKRARYNSLVDHEYKEGENTAQAKMLGTVAAVTKASQLDPTNMNLLAAGISSIEVVAKSRYGSYGPEYLALKTSELMDVFASGTVMALLEKNERDKATAVFTVLKPKLTADYANKIEAKINEANKDFSNYEIVEKARALGNYEAGLDFIKNQFRPGKSGATSFESFKMALVGQESGGNYEAKNPRTGAYGKYQILPENWPSWAVSAGLPANAPQTPENQERVMAAKLKPLYDKYGADGAAVAWYAGEQNAARWKAGLATAIGDNGKEYSWDMKQGNGDEPSVREYVQAIVGKAVGGGGIDIKAYDAAVARYNAMFAQDKKIELERKTAVVNTFLAQIDPDKTTYDEMVKSAKETGLTGAELYNLVSHGTQMLSLGTKIPYDQKKVDELQDKIASGEFTSPAQITTSKYVDEIPPKVLAKIIERMGNANNAELTKITKRVRDQLGLKDDDAKLYEEKLYNLYKQYKIENKGSLPTSAEWEKWAIAQAAMVTLERFPAKNDNVPLYKIPADAIWDNDKGHWKQKLPDGTWRIFHKEDFEKPKAAK